MKPKVRIKHEMQTKQAYVVYSRAMKSRVESNN